jgi:hypothetical protein
MLLQTQLPPSQAPHQPRRRLSRQAGVICAAVVWGGVELIALMRQRWVIRREQGGH